MNGMAVSSGDKICRRRMAPARCMERCRTKGAAEMVRCLEQVRPAMRLTAERWGKVRIFHFIKTYSA